ncbi:MAG: cytochrome c biogenesis protein ResB [Nitrospirae bacterium]|nr:cytochrome c biogenesis protein ResB [Nitrospirota bacterium]
MKFSGLLKNGYSYFRRPRTTVLIISVLLVLFALGLFIPQKKFFLSSGQYNQWKLQYPVMSSVIEYLKLNDIYVAPVTLLFLVLFFANLVTVVAHRTPLVLRRCYLLDREKLPDGVLQLKDGGNARKLVFECRDRESAEEVIGRAALFFRKRLWSVFRTGDSGFFLAVRNRFSPLGFLLFHISFLVCCIGGLLLVYTRFSGNLTLTEGEEFYADMSKFRLIRDNPIFMKALPNFGIAVLKVTPRYDGTTATDLSVRLRLKYEEDISEVVTRVNEPVNKGPVSVLPSNIGISPLFVLKRPGGEELDGGYFSLNIFKGEEDSFEFQGAPYKVHVKFFPDFAEQGGKAITRSLEIRNPVFLLRVERAGEKRFEGYMRLNEPVFIDGVEMYCKDIRYWVDFLIVREYGNTLLFAGFLLGATGLIMRLIFYQKTVSVNMEYDTGVCTLFIAGKGEYYTGIFQEELDKICLALDRHLAISDRPAGGGKGL